MRTQKHLSQRKLNETTAEILKILAKIEKNKNSPQLNTLLKILDSPGYTIEIVEKY